MKKNSYEILTRNPMISVIDSKVFIKNWDITLTSLSSVYFETGSMNIRMLFQHLPTSFKLLTLGDSTIAENE